VIPENGDSERDEQSSVKEENDNLPVDSNNEETDVTWTHTYNRPWSR
jgi:hypothetical protein